MVDAATLIELDEKIAAIRANISDLMEQAAAQSGAGDEERNAERLAEQQEMLDTLLQEREALS